MARILPSNSRAEPQKFFSGPLRRAVGTPGCDLTGLPSACRTERRSDEALARSLRWRRLLLARIATRKRRGRRLGLVWLSWARRIEQERARVDGRASENRIAMELPVEVDVAVVGNDGLGRF